MHPKHISKVPNTVREKAKKSGKWIEEDVKRRAIAPYNFIELPDRIVEAQKYSSRSKYCSGNDAANKRYTGQITCKLTTASPLYIRSGLLPSDFDTSIDKSNSVDDLNKLNTDERSRRADFFKKPGASQPCIPGSSLRGMLRALVEIVSFSKIDKVSDAQKLFFRAVAIVSSKDSLAAEYKHYVAPDQIKAGYLRYEQNGWYIQPAIENNGHTFAWVEQTSVVLEQLTEFDDISYRPQYHQISFDQANIRQTDPVRRLFANRVSSSGVYKEQGQLVTSGNMNLGGSSPSPRANHCVVFRPAEGRLKIDSVAIKHYLDSLTDFQKEIPFSEKFGFLKAGRAVFYYPPENNQSVGFFGQSPNFRIPYSVNANGHAATVKDFVPKHLQNVEMIDLAESIFGYVRDEKVDNIEQNRASRIFVSDADCTHENDDIWLSNRAVSPPILGGPKPTTISHYLVQPEETEARQSKLKHYASTLEETVIRGHKLYWNKGDVRIDKLTTDSTVVEQSPSQYTEIKPVKSGVSFAFSVHFENLSEVELGLLLWVLSLSNEKSQLFETGKSEEHYCFSLGMGKPLGMGAINIAYSMQLSDRKQRYSQLFDHDAWGKSDSDSDNSLEQDLIKEFERFMLNRETGISRSDHPQTGRATTLKEVPRIEMLLAMLRFDKSPPSIQTQYMTIEPNQYKDRRVLPTPLDIMRIEDNRQTSISEDTLEDELSEEGMTPPTEAALNELLRRFGRNQG